MDQVNPGLAAYLLLLVAEFGDKSQIICLILASRYRALPVFVGACLAFTLLTGLAVVVGDTLNTWIPDAPLHFFVAALFAIFGIQMLWSSESTDTEPQVKTSTQSVVFSVFILISLAEMGDKTQLLVVSLSTLEHALAVFFGATLALMTTSALGVWAGTSMLKPAHLKWVHRVGALLFFLFALIAVQRGFLAL